MPIQSVNPATGALISTYPTLSKHAVELKITEGYTAWKAWKSVSYSTRAKYLQKAAEILRSRSEEFAKLMAVEMGKPLRAGRAEIEKCALCCEFYASHAEEMLSDERISTEASSSYISYQPLGLILGVMPWNFPFWQVFRFLAPTLMAGNGAVLKHASNVPGCAMAIEELLLQAGFPEKIFQTFLIGSDLVEFVLEHPAIAAVSLTGSTEAGARVAAKASSLIKKSVLELGGSDAYLILEDADLEHAAKVCAESRLINSGQSCIAAKRFIVVEPVATAFTELMKQEMQKKIMGNPLEEGTDIGPMARKELRDELHLQVQKSIAMGAECILGGEIPEGPGAFYPPTLLRKAEKGMPVFDEETFGPVAAIVVARDEEEAITLANDSPYGLGACVFSRNIKHAENIAVARLEAGACFVNEGVKSDVRLPFGGIKGSGYGRELSAYGIKEFTNVKTVFVR